MNSTKFLVMGVLLLSTACSSFNQNTKSRTVADDGRWRGDRWRDGRHDG